MAREKRSATVVTLACKLPQGLHIHLKNDDGIVQKTIKLHGMHSPYAIAGYGLTQGVSVADWEAIQKQHADAAWLVNGFVFANSDGDSLASEADERKNERTGFEAVNPRELPGNIQVEGSNDPVA